MFLYCFQNSQENTCARVFFLLKLHVEDITRYYIQVFSCIFWETFKNTFFTEQLRVNVFGILQNSHSDNYFSWRFFCNKIVGCMFATLLQQLCHRRFPEDFLKLLSITTFQNSGRLLQISPEPTKACSISFW